MYLETGLAQAFRPRSKYKPARLVNVTATWDLEVPFRKDFGAFRQELSKAIGQLVTAPTDKTESARLLLKEVTLKRLHDQLLKRKSPTLKESDAVGVFAYITFNKDDYTDIHGIRVYAR
jgi:hypothetical protein